MLFDRLLVWGSAISKGLSLGVRVLRKYKDRLSIESIVLLWVDSCLQRNRYSEEPADHIMYPITILL